MSSPGGAHHNTPPHYTAPPSPTARPTTGARHPSPTKKYSITSSPHTNGTHVHANGNLHSPNTKDTHTAPVHNTPSKTLFSFWKKLEEKASEITSAVKRSPQPHSSPHSARRPDHSPAHTPTAPKQHTDHSQAHDAVKEFSLGEVVHHHTDGSYWIVIDPHVYDVSSILPNMAQTLGITPMQAGQDLEACCKDEALSFILAGLITHLHIGRIASSEPHTPPLPAHALYAGPSSSTPRDDKFTLLEVLVHNRPDDCWVALGPHVYNMTPFVSRYASYRHKDLADAVEEVITNSSLPLGHVLAFFAPQARVGTVQSAMYEMGEVSRHRTSSDCWVVVDGDVFDISKLTQNKVPLFGNNPFDIRLAGMDITSILNEFDIDTDLVKSHGAKLYIGKLKKTPPASSPAATASSSSSPSPATATATPAKPAAAARDFRADTRKIWERTVDKLPVASDVPRLASFTEVAGQRLPGPDEPKQSVLAVLLALRGLLYGQGGDLTDEKLTQLFTARIPDATDQTTFPKQFPKLLLEDLTESNQIVRVLKAIHQAIIAPSVIELRMSICPKLPFKDTPGGWHVRVFRRPDGQVEVQHARRQEHMDKRKEEEYLEFTWVLSMVFDAEVSAMNEVRLEIRDLVYGPATTDAKKAEYAALFANHMMVS
eukprot:TRINITY_DN4975_c0_g1_i2.p1 TRINITY_DN4975_c0_g1~~TRINITY_DN4975_c0_g1_i2.p1  ORF type:complete len:726 (+),score=190.10 TRINITY_DN4975_c0_g1_i2:219-2180(+)